MGRPLLKPMNKQAMLRDYKSGMSLSDLGRKWSVSVGTAYNYMKAAGCKFRSKSDSTLLAASRGKMHGPRLSGENNHKWNGGQHITCGYMSVRLPGHPKAMAGGYVLQHVLIMEDAISRPLSGTEVVHHINEDKLDNRLENLCVMSDHDHKSLHARKRWAAKKLNPTGAKRF